MCVHIANYQQCIAIFFIHPCWSFVRARGRWELAEKNRFHEYSIFSFMMNRCVLHGSSRRKYGHRDIKLKKKSINLRIRQMRSVTIQDAHSSKACRSRRRAVSPIYKNGYTTQYSKYIILECVYTHSCTLSTWISKKVWSILRYLIHQVWGTVWGT